MPIRLFDDAAAKAALKARARRADHDQLCVLLVGETALLTKSSA
jgi:hypothetical protein